MSAAVWIQTIAGSCAILGAIGVGVRYLVKHYLIELKPNHGSSLNDAVKLQILPLIQELSKDMTLVKVSVAKLEGRFEQHIEEALD
jgi:hypothetical protein